MASSSPTVSSQIAAESQTAWKALEPVKKFLVRRRILLSAILFSAMLVKDVVYGLKPHDPVNIRDLYGMLGVLLVVTGLGLRSWAAGILHKNAQLTTCGPYRLIRNPLYVGSFLMMFGFCTLLSNPWDLWFILGPVLLLYVVKVRQEERLLARLFPAEWSEYSRTTPRFFPRLARTNVTSPWRIAQWMRSREYQALGATIVALAAIKAWQAYG